MTAVTALTDSLGRLLRWRGTWALISRSYVYLSGFLAVFVMAASMTPATFGAYSVYQSVLELGIIIGTLGSSLLFSRNAAMRPPTVFSGDVVRTLAVGIPIAGVVMALLLALQQMPVADAASAIVLPSLALFCFNGLRLAYGRGLGAAGLLNLEAGIRSTVLLAGMGGLLLAGFSLSVGTLLMINLFAIALISVTIIRVTGDIALPAGPAALRLRTQAGAVGYSLLVFVLRKSDLLIVGFFMPLSYLGAFKLAFLLAEAPSQFVQAYLYTKTKTMLHSERPTADREKHLLAPRALALGACLFIALGALLFICAQLLKFSVEVRSIFWVMLPFFLLRTYTVHHELVLQLNTSIRRLGRWALAETGIKVALYAVVWLLFPSRPHYVFAFSFFSELILYEFRMKALWGFIPAWASLTKLRS